MFFPFQIDRRLKSVPWLTIALIAVNTVIYLAVLPVERQVWDALGFRANLGGLITWFTSMWLHGDPMHLLSNMYFLWLFGSVVEDAIGRVRYALLYTLGGLAAAFIHGLVTATFVPQAIHVPAIGASGAIAAILGVFAVRMYKNRVRIAYFFMIFFYPRWGTFTISSIWAIALWGVNELFSGLIGLTGYTNGVANWAHIGGLVFGVLAAFVFHLGVEADTEALREQADAYAASGVAGAAAATYAKLAERAPEDADMIVARAKAEAASRYETATPRAVDSVVADAARAVEMLLKQGKRDEALAAVRDLIDPPCSLELLPRTLLIGGSLAEAKRDFAFSATLYGDVIRRTPAGSAEAEKAWFRLAHVYHAAGRPEEARRVWAAYRHHYPASAWVQYADAGLLALG